MINKFPNISVALVTAERVYKFVKEWMSGRRQFYYVDFFSFFFQPLATYSFSHIIRDQYT